jgi:hypothetical protein
VYSSKKLRGIGLWESSFYRAIFAKLRNWDSAPFAHRHLANLEACSAFLRSIALKMAPTQATICFCVGTVQVSVVEQGNRLSSAINNQPRHVGARIMPFRIEILPRPAHLAGVERGNQQCLTSS